MLKSKEQFTFKMLYNIAPVTAQRRRCLDILAELNKYSALKETENTPVFKAYSVALSYQLYV